jgi:hypothetical protein
MFGQTSTRSAAQLLGPITVAAVLVILVLSGRDTLRDALTDRAPAPAPAIGTAGADATVELDPPPTLEAAITVTAAAILVAGKVVVQLDDGAVQPADLAPDGTIAPLAIVLRAARVATPPVEGVEPPWERTAVIAVDRTARYGVVRAAAATARSVGLTQIRYASPNGGR